MRKITSFEWEQIASLFAGHSGIIAAWVFGSAQTGELRPGSDLDVAVLFDAVPTLDKMADLRADLQQLLQIDDIDLVGLNNASPILRFEAISGRTVFCQDVGTRATFASRTAREYEDEIAFARRGMRAH